MKHVYQTFDVLSMLSPTLALSFKLTEFSLDFPATFFIVEEALDLSGTVLDTDAKKKKNIKF